jgi:hypothetical protein
VCAEIHIGHLLGQFELHKCVGGIPVMSNPFGVSCYIANLVLSSNKTVLELYGLFGKDMYRTEQSSGVVSFENSKK